MEEASTVVSERGETLSPKYAPEMMAPAVMASENPSARPIPSRATPTVAMVVQEEPVITETRAQRAQAVRRKTLGLMILRP